MKREGDVWAKFISKENIKKAIINAAKGKRRYRKVRKVLNNIDEYVDKLYELLTNDLFVPSPYVTSILKTEYGKEREIFKLPFFPDRVVQHDVSLCLRPRLTRAMTSDTYACIKDRGINCNNARFNLNKKVKRVIESPRYRHCTLYCLKMDIRKCYPSVDNKKLAELNRKYCKDKKMLELLDLLNFNDGCSGLPIGNFLSQLWINIVLTELDRYVKEELKVKHYFRYMDDIVIISDDKKELHQWQWRIMNFVWYELRMEMNEKRQVFPVSDNRQGRGIDYGGYVFHRGFTLVRKRIKIAFAKNRHKPLSVPSYIGILQHCDARHLTEKIVNKDNKETRSEKDMQLTQCGIKIDRPFEGDNIKIEQVIDKKIEVLDFDVRPSEKKPGSDYLKMQIRYEGRKRFIGGGYQFLCDFLKNAEKQYGKDQLLPLTDVIIRHKRGYYFDGTIDEE